MWRTTWKGMWKAPRQPSEPTMAPRRTFLHHIAGDGQG